LLGIGYDIGTRNVRIHNFSKLTTFTRKPATGKIGIIVGIT